MAILDNIKHNCLINQLGINTKKDINFTLKTYKGVGLLMINEIFRTDDIGNIEIIGENTFGLPMWSINYFIQEFCRNYNRLIIITRICRLAQMGASDNQFIVAKRSASLFPDKTIKDTFDYNYYKNYIVLTMEDFDHNYENYILYTNKEENHVKFWHIINNYARPMVFYKHGRDIYPLIDITYEDAIKITRLSYNSPVEINIQGAINGLIDLATAGKRFIMYEEEHTARQIGLLADNYRRISLASQVISDPRTPRGIQHYAQMGLESLLEKQAKLNERLGIRLQRIDKKL